MSTEFTRAWASTDRGCTRIRWTQGVNRHSPAGRATQTQLVARTHSPSNQRSSLTTIYRRQELQEQNKNCRPSVVARRSTRLMFNVRSFFFFFFISGILMVFFLLGNHATNAAESHVQTHVVNNPLRIWAFFRLHQMNMLGSKPYCWRFLGKLQSLLLLYRQEVLVWWSLSSETRSKSVFINIDPRTRVDAWFHISLLLLSQELESRVCCIQHPRSMKDVSRWKIYLTWCRMRMGPNYSPTKASWL